MILQQRRHRKPSLRAAFTLMEVLVVVAIIVILAGIGVAVFGYLEPAKEDVARATIKNIETATLTWKLHHDDFPQSLAELTVPTDGKPALLKKADLKDPWGRPWQYDPSKRAPTGEPWISSQGAGSSGRPIVSKVWE